MNPAHISNIFCILPYVIIYSFIIGVFYGFYLRIRIYLIDRKIAINRARRIHGCQYKYKLKFGHRPNLSELKPNESVCSAGMKWHHVLIIKENYSKTLV